MAGPSRCNLYLISPPLGLESAGAFALQLQPLLELGLASLLIRLESPAEADAKKIIHSLLPLAASAGAALLVENDARLAARAGADGAHIGGAPADLAAALASLKPERIVGAGLLRNRDEAMGAGEAGADYVMFGEPRRDGYTPPAGETLERIAWWAEIFEPPCVGYAGSLDDIAPLAAAGADFIALGDAIWKAPSARQALEAALAQMEIR